MNPYSYLDLIPRIEQCRTRVISWRDPKSKKDLTLLMNNVTRYHSKVMYDLIHCAKKGKITAREQDYLDNLTELVVTLEHQLTIASLL